MTPQGIRNTQIDINDLLSIRCRYQAFRRKMTLYRMSNRRMNKNRIKTGVEHRNQTRYALIIYINKSPHTWVPVYLGLIYMGQLLITAVEFHLRSRICLEDLTWGNSLHYTIFSGLLPSLNGLCSGVKQKLHHVNRPHLLWLLFAHPSPCPSRAQG